MTRSVGRDVGRNFSSGTSGTRAIPTIVVAALIVTGGLTGASPAICPLPGPFIPQPSQPAQPSRTDVDRLIDRLGAFDLDVRADAARSIRRAPGTVALPALLDAASGHADGFVRRRSLVLLSGYDDPRVPDQMEQAAAEASDALRTIAYRYFERHPDPRLAPMLLRALPKDTAEFARPALIRALAALGRDLKVQKALLAELARPSDASRGDTIEALGDHKATYALKSLATLAKTEGPFQDRAALALCQLGTDCHARREAFVKALAEPSPYVGFESLLRAAAFGLADLAVAGDVEAGQALIEAGAPRNSPAAELVAEAVTDIAVRRPDAILPLLADAEGLRTGVALLTSGLTRRGDDFGEEQFCVRMRALYFAAAEGAPARESIQAVLNRLEF